MKKKIERKVEVMGRCVAGGVRAGAYSEKSNRIGTLRTIHGVMWRFGNLAQCGTSDLPLRGHCLIAIARLSGSGAQDDRVELGVYEAPHSSSADTARVGHLQD